MTMLSSLTIFIGAQTSVLAFLPENFWDSITDLKNLKPGLRENQTSVQNNVSVSVETGNNTAAGNAVKTGSAKATVEISNVIDGTSTEPIKIDVQSLGEPIEIKKEFGSPNAKTEIEIKVNTNQAEESGRPLRGIGERLNGFWLRLSVSLRNVFNFF